MKKSLKSNHIRIIEYRRVRDRKALARLNDPAKVADLCLNLNLFPDDGKERFGVFLLTLANDVFAYHPVSTGSAEFSVVSPREVFAPALREVGCTRVILVHNHPSGDSYPSQEDIGLTKALVRAGRVLDVRVLDHVIVAADGTFTSMAQEGFIVDEVHKDTKAAKLAGS